MAEYVIDTAKRLGLSARQDHFGNVVVKKSAFPGLSHARSIALQGHLDMVCEKNADKVHDFSRDPISLVRKGNMLMADGSVRFFPYSSAQVLVGVDAVTPRSVLNKVGTRDLAEAAAARDIPVFAVAGSSKLVPVEIPVADPYQATPIQLFTHIATPGGVAEPVLAAARAAAIRLHPALVMLSEMLLAETQEQSPADAPLGESAPDR